MEELGNLDDHELDQLSWKLNPQEFDRIAMQYLRLKRVSCNFGTSTRVYTYM